MFLKSNLQLSLAKWYWLSSLSQGWKHLFYLLLSGTGGPTGQSSGALGTVSS